jgi:hypothetical protein
MFILTSEASRGVSSFPAAVREAGNQVFYSDKEYAECSLVKRVVDRVRHVAFAKLAEL